PTQYSADPVYYGYYMLPDGTFCLAPPPPGIDATAYYNSMPTAAVAPPTASSAHQPHMGTPTPPQTVALAPPGVSPVQIPATVPPPAALPEPSSKLDVPLSSPAMPAIIPPPPDTQPVIDKLAEYVARNGLKFESSVRAKNDPRFDFLLPWHQYNTYYEFKKKYFMQKEGKDPPERSAEDASDKLQSDESLQDSKLNKASFAPISFAIKAKENDMLPLEKNRVRLDDDSDEEKLEMEEEASEVVMPVPELVTREVVPLAVQEEKKPTLSLEELEAKQAKHKLEDRLAAAAREKLAQASKESKEKQLQAERKRKAALFLQTLRGPGTGEPEAKRAELDAATQYEMQEALSALSDMSSVAPVYAPDQRAPTETHTAYRSRDETASSSHSRGSDRERDKGRDKDKKKKKHKRRSRSPTSKSRSRSRSKSKHSLPSAYRRGHRSRSRSYSPGRRSRRGASSERRYEERERERYHRSSSSGAPRGHSRSRSPSEKSRTSLLSGLAQAAGSSLSPYSSPSGASPAASPASSLTHSRDGSQEKDKAVSSTIVSSVQSKITQDLMAKVRAMLATSKTFQPPTS
ncbi:splicing factor, suppressor of white-apricot homolog, partial [Boleophthalmus pectinirostris]|uniref:splicing factor, suppressor of white-apricot homolog n=1 Tax=Boleophthalmus pectinirostris TaxID=150288 RepID=UPI00242BB2C5